jgi:hypothetical protein
MTKLLHNRLVIVTGAALALVLLGAGTSVGRSLVTGSDIKNGTITTKDIRNEGVMRADIETGAVRSDEIYNGTIKKHDLAPDLVKHLQGAPGPKGATGPAGPAGPAGAPGQVLVTSKLTAANPAYGGAVVVDVPSQPPSSGGPGASEGTDLVGPIHLDQGAYIVSLTAQFFDFQPTAGTPDVDYGVVRPFLNGVAVAPGPSWTPTVPDDGNNAAQVSGSLVLQIPAGGATLTARAALRGGDGGQAGATVLVTKIQPAS